MDEEIAAAYAAIKESEALRASYRRRCLTTETGLGERERQLMQKRADLSWIREPLRRHLLHAPKATARYYAPEVRAASAAITRERKRLERMIYGKGGRAGYGDPKPVKIKVPLSHLTGTTRQAAGVARAGAGEIGAMEKLAAGPLPMERAFELARDAGTHVDQLRAARLRVANAQRRVKNSQVFARRPFRRLDAEDVKAERVKKDLRKLEQRYSRVALVAPDKQVRPQREWTRQQALDALDEWAKTHGGRWPTARELPKHKMLPSRGTLGNLRISLVQDAPEARE